MERLRMLDWKEVTGLTINLRVCSLSSASLYLVYCSAVGSSGICVVSMRLMLAGCSLTSSSAVVFFLFCSSLLSRDLAAASAALSVNFSVAFWVAFRAALFKMSPSCALAVNAVRVRQASRSNVFFFIIVWFYYYWVIYILF